MSTINNFNSSNINSSIDLAKDALSLAKAVNGGSTQEILNTTSALFQDLSGIIGGSQSNTNTAQSAPMSSKLSTTDMMKLFGMDMQSQEENKTKDAIAAVASGQITSFSQLLAVVGSLLAKTQQKLADKITDQAKQLDAQQNAPGSKGISFESQQEFQRNISALQEVGNLLKNLNETITNAIKTDDTVKSAVARNLAI